jgi:hypothetical protein
MKEKSGKFGTIIKKDLKGLEFEIPDETEEISESDLCILIKKKVRQLLNKDFNKLILLLYRLDVNEQKFNFVLSQSVENHVSGIANLILEREKEKLFWREKYQS